MWGERERKKEREMQKKNGGRTGVKIDKGKG